MFWRNKFICDLKKKTFQIDIFKKKAYRRYYEMCKIDDNSNNKHGDFFSYDKIGRKK